MARRNWHRVVALTAAVGIVAAACGGDDGGDEAGTTETSAAATTETSAAATTETSAAATTETSAAAAGGVGLIDGIYKGVSGFEIDPADCPEDWDPNQGITDSEIRLFTSLPTSGPLAGFGLLADGGKVWFDHVNAEGGIGGRKIVVDVKDDAYAPDKTKTNVDEAIGSGNYAALVVTLGTANNLAIWDTTNDECMPQLLNGTGAAQWGDVENHPWTTGMQIDYFSEAQLWAEWLKTNSPDTKKVAQLTFNNDFGKSYSKGFKAAIEGTDIEIVKEELHEPTAPNLTNQFTSLAASGADVLLIQTSGAFCTQAMAEVEKGSWKPVVIMSATCGSLGQFFKPLIDQGLTGDGTHIIQTFKDVNDAEYADDPFVKQYQELVTAAGLDPKQSTYATGFIFAWYMTEILKLAETYEGGLDRGNIMLAARAIDKPMPLLLDGLTAKMDGMKDAYLTEGGRMVKYTVGADKTQFGTFVQVGELLNNEGKLGTFATVAAIAE